MPSTSDAFLWPSSWRAWLDDSSWRRALQDALHRRDLSAALLLCDCFIGLETHLRLDCSRKLFCSAPLGRAGWVDMGFPGALPSLDPQAIERAEALGDALGARFDPLFAFERKRYAYPDLSKGYQTTQKALPVWSGGRLRLGDRELALTRAQIEEDAARVKRHEGGFTIDFERAGAPLLEVVSEAAMMSPSEACGWAQALWRETIFSGAGLGLIESSGFKTDINLSVRPHGAEGLGERVEIKGIGPFESIDLASLSAFWLLVGELLGDSPCRSRSFGVDDQGALLLMREKPLESRYRFLPDGDLAPRRRHSSRMGSGSDAHSALSLLISSLGADPETARLWEDPRKLRLAFDALRSLGSLGSLDSLTSSAMARSFFSRSSTLAFSVSDGSLALSWSWRHARDGHDRSLTIEAALTALSSSGFDSTLAGIALSELSSREAPVDLSEAFLALVSSDPLCAQAWRQAQSGKLKALGLLVGKLSSARADISARAISAWLHAHLSALSGGSHV